MKSNILRILLVLLLVGCSSLESRYSQPSPTVSPTIVPDPPPTVTTISPTEYLVTTDLEKRSCPSVSCANVGYYHEGNMVMVDGWLYDNKLKECQRWAHIANETHWVCANYLIKPVSVKEPGSGAVYVEPDYDPNSYSVCFDNAPVYGNPGGGTDVLYYLPAGTIVKIRERSQGTLGWAMIKDSRWILFEYLCILKK